MYCEKPICLTIAEGRALVETTGRYGTVWQCGTQRRSNPAYRFVAEKVRGGAIGRLRTITMSFGGWGFSFEFAGATKTDGIFDMLDILTTNFLLPLGGLAIALFAGWVMSRADTVDEMGVGESGKYRLWRVLVRYISPAAVVVMFLHTLGVV